MNRIRTACSALALVALGCDSGPDFSSVVLDEEPVVEDKPPPQDAAPPYDVPACKSCLAVACTTERVRCFSEPGCVAIAQCASQRNCNQECINRCVFNQTGLGRRPYHALTACEFETTCGDCADTCDSTSLCVLRAQGKTPPPAAPPTCRGCMGQRCQAEVAACAPGTECAAYFDCTNPCPTPREKCVEACDAKLPAGKTAGQSLVTCSNTSCEAQCAY